MKKLLALITAACVIALAAPTAYAEAEKNSETAELNFRGYSWAGEISEDTPDKLSNQRTLLFRSHSLPTGKSSPFMILILDG